LVEVYTGPKKAAAIRWVPSAEEATVVQRFVGKVHIMDHAILQTSNWTEYGLHAYSVNSDPYDPAVDAKMKHNHRVYQEIVKSYGFDYADGLYMANLQELFNEALNVHNLEWTVDKALRFIVQEKDNPFFLYFSTTLHHGPVPWGIREGKYWSSFNADPKLTGEGVVDTAWDFKNRPFGEFTGGAIP